MHFRKIPRKHAIVSIIVFTVVLAAAVYLISSNTPNSAAGPKKAFFSVNDGKTWFIDDINKYPPFEHEGKTAVRARLFSTDGGKTIFCGYLERYTPEAKSTLEESERIGGRGSGSRPQANLDVILQGIEAKVPGGSAWVNRSAGPAYAEIVIVRGKAPGDIVEEILP